MGAYQKFRGDPEQKLFYLLSDFLGGINTEFSDDNSSDIDFESIINFDMDKLGTLNKRGGFGELTAISQIFNRLLSSDLPNIKNRTEGKPNPEDENDNVVYMKLLRNDNNCFRNLSGFSGEKAYRKYQEMYGFQHNRFTLLMITSRITNNVVTSSKAWLYQCYLPELEYVSGAITDTETMTITCNSTTLPVLFNWDRNLMNIETIEFYDKIYFTGNNSCLVTFDRSASVTTDTDLANAFKYTYNYGTTPTTNSAHVPTGLEVRNIGFNLLCDDPMHSVDRQGLSTDSIQAVYICTTDNIPLDHFPLGQSALLNIIYTGSDNGFEISMKEGDNDVSFSSSVNTTLSTTGLKVYNITFTNAPSGEIEVKIVKTGASIEPHYDYFNVKVIEDNLKPVAHLNIGDYGICEMYDRAVYYKADTMWFSEVNMFDYIPDSNYVTLPLEPTDEITKICYFKKCYIIFTKQKIYKMVGTYGSTEFAVQPVNTSLGCHAGNTVVPIEDTLYFASPRGVYALKSSTFVEGYENVKELDLKVKKLTSGFTRYDDNLAAPAIRFNGISKRAYAVRYKDKYLLFYNNYADKGDYAAVNDLDTLAYQFDLGAFTTYRFKEKPTFLFMVDNAIETFSTVEEDKLYEEEQVEVEYDFVNSSGTTVQDLSGNDRTGYVKGGYGIVPIKGISMSSDYGDCDVNTVIDDIDFTEGFSLKMDIENTINDEYDYQFYYPFIYLFQMDNNRYTFPTFSENSTGSVNLTKRISNVLVYDYTLTDELTYTFSQLTQTSVQVIPQIKLTISDPKLGISGKFTYSLSGNDGTLISGVIDNVVFDNGYIKTIDLPTFIVETDEYTNYVNNWVFSLSYETSITTPITDDLVFDLSHVREFSGDVSFTNMAYGGSNVNLPHYVIYSYLDENGKILVDLITMDYAGPDNSGYRMEDQRTLRGNYVYDFARNRRQTLEIKFIPEGLYLKCSCYLNGEKTEDLGYFPMDVIENLPSHALNTLRICYEDRDAYGPIEDPSGVKNYFEGGNIYYVEFTVNDTKTSKYNFTDGSGDEAADASGYYPMYIGDCEWIDTSSGIVFDGENTYLEMPVLPASIPFNQGFYLEFEGSFSDKIIAKIFDIATIYDNGKMENKNASINCEIDTGKIRMSTNSLDYKSYSLTFGNIDITQNHKYKFDCVYNEDRTYTLSLYIDDDVTAIKHINFIGGISNVIRTSCFLGKSNTVTDKLLKGNLKTFKLATYINTDPITYRTAVYEFDTTTTDFGKDMYVELVTKGLNMKYPQHMKKLKHIFVKAIGGNNYGEFFFELYADGHRVNDPRIFYAYLDENGTIVYDYTGEKILTLDEVKSILGNIRLGSTKLGEGKYQTKKLVIPKKAKNFSCKLYGDTNDYLSIESFGFVCKLGKVKEG